MALKLVERLKIEYFVDYSSEKKAVKNKQMSELLDMQKRMYNITSTGGGLFLEITDDK